MDRLTQRNLRQEIKFAIFHAQHPEDGDEEDDRGKTVFLNENKNNIFMN